MFLPIFPLTPAQPLGSGAKSQGMEEAVLNSKRKSYGKASRGCAVKASNVDLCIGLGSGLCPHQRRVESKGGEEGTRGTP